MFQGDFVEETVTKATPVSTTITGDSGEVHRGATSEAAPEGIPVKGDQLGDPDLKF